MFSHSFPLEITAIYDLTTHAKRQGTAEQSLGSKQHTQKVLQ